MDADPQAQEPAPAKPLASRASGLDFFVVGIGASAGGIQAVRTLLEGFPSDTRMAFVVVLHLSPTHESNVAAILQNSTRMTVEQVKGRVRIQSRHVYVIPPGHELAMDDGHLDLAPSTRSAGPHVVIDGFFRALALAHRTRAVGIVLSGTGSDGSLGIGALKEHGGIVIAQSPHDAEYDGMPAAAIQTGKVDIVLPVAEMAQCLLDLWRNASRIELPGASDVDADIAESRAPVRAEAALAAILAELKLRTGNDFAHYKRATVLRRIERRMQVTRQPTLVEYQEFLQANTVESRELLGDMLIGVTQFFRDRPAFEALEREVLPALFARLDADRSLRIWVPACSSGEEAYSIAMLVSEEAARHPEPTKFTLFASDIDTQAIATAREGRYPAGIDNDVIPTRLRAFFTPDRSHHRVVKSLREHLVFAAHNLLHDPPFSRVHLVSCRNLLIYLDREAQQQAMEIFHFAMQPGGYLFLGSSETVDVAPRLFTAVDKARRIYRANPVARSVRPAELRPVIAGPILAAPARNAASAPVSTTSEIHRELVAQVSPPSVLITAGGEIVNVSAKAARYLRYAPGEPTHAMFDAVPVELRQALRTATAQANQLKTKVASESVAMQMEGGHVVVRMSVLPVQHPAWPAPLLLVTFEEAVSAAGRPVRSDDPAMANLEDELQLRNEQVRSTVEQYETSAEELKASNEELQAINEELRSASEELETSKEELQSTNEELITVNHELQEKIEEASDINDDLNNFITSSNTATVFVDPEMRIKRFTPAAASIFNLIDTDVGRSLFDITHRLDYERLAEDARAVFSTLNSIEREVTTLEGARLLARLLPYRTSENRIGGAVLNFIDVTSLRKVEREREIEEGRTRIVSETMTDFAILTLDPEGVITSWSPGARNVFGYDEGEAIGRDFALLFSEDDRAAGIPREEMETAAKVGRASDDRWMLRKGGIRFFASGVLAPLAAGGGLGFAKICRDTTSERSDGESTVRALHTAQEGEAYAVAESERKNEFLAVMSHELKHPLNLISVNAQMLTTLPEVQSLPAVLRAARTIQRTVLSQGRIIDDLLDMSRVHTGKLTVNRAPLVLGEAIQAAVNWAIVEGRARHLRILVEGLDEPLTIDGDITRIEQIALNLLSNAIKFSPNGGTIQVRLEKRGDEALLTVSDAGRGIEAEFLPHVFELFKQADSTTRRHEGGLGIGLAMVKSLSEMHGGRIEVESGGRDAGATFRIFLPLHVRSDFASLPLAAASDSPPQLVGLRVLLVDDTEDALETFGYLLRHYGMVVATATSAKLALAASDDQPFDLLISDLGMPETDGYQLAKEWRARPRTAQVPAIALSGHGRQENVDRAYAAGFQAHVDKPVDIEHMKAVIATVLSRSPQKPG